MSDTKKSTTIHLSEEGIKILLQMINDWKLGPEWWRVSDAHDLANELNEQL